MQIFNSKKAMAVPLSALLLILVIVGAVWYFGGSSGESSTLSIGSNQNQQQTNVGSCAVEDTTLTLNAFDLENKGTSVGTVTHTVWLNGNYFGTVANTGTASVSPGDKVTVLYGNESESTSIGYYPAVKEFTVGCKGTVTETAFLKDKNSSAITINAFNGDDGLINQITDNQSIGANEVVTMTLKMKGTSQDYFGESNVIVVLSGSQTTFKDVSIEGAKKVSVPGQFSPAASSKAWAYEIPNLVGAKWNEYSLVVEETSTDNTGQPLTVTLYDNSYFVNADTNDVELGYEDEDDNDVGSLNPSATIYFI